MGDGVTQYKTEARCPFFKSAVRTRARCGPRRRSTMLTEPSGLTESAWPYEFGSPSFATSR